MNFFKNLCFISIYSINIYILNTLSECTYFYISKRHYFIHFLAWSLQCILKDFISKRTICQTFESKKWPYLPLLIEFLKKLVCACKLCLKGLDEDMRLIISLKRFSVSLYSSTAKLWMFLWWIVKTWFFEVIPGKNLCCLYIQFIVSDPVGD